MQKDSKEYREAKLAGKEAIDAADANRVYPAFDSTIGHEEGEPGTWNTSGVEVPANRGAVRDVRVETGDAVSLEGLKEAGVPIRDESNFGDNVAPEEAPVADKVKAPAEKADAKAPAKKPSSAKNAK